MHTAVSRLLRSGRGLAIAGLACGRMVQVGAEEHLGTVTRHGDATHRTVEVLSKTYTIASKYKSMQGPASNQQVWLLGEGQPPEFCT